MVLSCRRTILLLGRTARTHAKASCKHAAGGLVCVRGVMRCPWEVPFPPHPFTLGQLKGPYLALEANFRGTPTSRHRADEANARLQINFCVQQTAQLEGELGRLRVEESALKRTIN